MSPALVASIRAIILGALSAVAIALIAYFSSPGVAAWWSVPVIAVLRQFEGIVDKWRGQAPQKPLGSHPAP